MDWSTGGKPGVRMTPWKVDEKKPNLSEDVADSVRWEGRKRGCGP